MSDTAMSEIVRDLIDYKISTLTGKSEAQKTMARQKLVTEYQNLSTGTILRRFEKHCCKGKIKA